MVIDSPASVDETARRTGSIRWAAWCGDYDLELSFPGTWDVEEYRPADGPDIGEDGIAHAFAAPIGTLPLRDLARGRTSACIVVDDLTRPTDGARLLPRILAELRAGGLGSEDVLVLAGVANHRPMTRADFIKKVGEDVVARCRTQNHFSWHGCRNIGTTGHGTPVALNAEFLDADLRILVGSIVPHPVTGFSGGSKLVLPGVAGINTAGEFHGPSGPETGLGTVANRARADSEEAARMAGVHCVVNVVPNSRRGIAGLVVGDVVAAHRAGVQIARRVFATKTPAGIDLCVLSAYPKDTEFLQFITAFSLWASAANPIVREGGTVIVATLASEGSGFHSLAGRGMRLYQPKNWRKTVGPRDLLLFSPGAQPADVPDGAGGNVWLFQDWHAAERWLEAKHGAKAKVAVFPCASMQLSEEACRAAI